MSADNANPRYKQTHDFNVWECYIEELAEWSGRLGKVKTEI